MPLTKSGKKVLAEMKKEYGDEKGKQVFYASMNKKGSKWHKKTKSGNFSKEAIAVANRRMS
jgi:hypothetical protein